MAKKKKKKKVSRPTADRTRKMIKEFQEIMPGANVVKGNDDDKLSEVIIDFAEPLLKSCTSLRMKKQALSFAVLVWNISMMAEKNSEPIKSKLEKMLCNGDPDQTEYMYELLNFMVERKDLLYKDDERFVLKYHITTTKKGELHLDVVYPTKKPPGDDKSAGLEA
ncbi:MAG: hypothetical protein AB1796_08405 [Bacillota bacterium]